MAEEKRGSNFRQAQIGLKREAMLNAALPPAERLRSARQYLALIKPNRSNVPPIRALIREFINNGDPDISTRAEKLRSALLKRLDLRDVQDPGADEPEVSTPIIQPSAEPASVEPEQPQFDWPPKNIQFPPPAGLYEMGTIDMSQVADRIRHAGLKGHPPRLTSDELNENIIRAAIGQPLAPITLDLLQQISFALEYERKAEDPLMSGDRFRFWPFVYLHNAVSYIARQRFGYGSLQKAPPSPVYVRALLQKPKSELSVYECLDLSGGNNAA